MNLCCNEYLASLKPPDRESTRDPNPRIRRVAIAVWAHLDHLDRALPGFEYGVRILAHLAVVAEDERASIERHKLAPDTPANRKALRRLRTLHRRSAALLKSYRQDFLNPPIPTDSPADGGESGNV